MSKSTFAMCKDGMFWGFIAHFPNPQTISLGVFQVDTHTVYHFDASVHKRSVDSLGDSHNG